MPARGPTKIRIVRSAYLRYDVNAGWSSLVARWAHNPKVAGSNPAPATTGSFRRREMSPTSFEACRGNTHRCRLAVPIPTSEVLSHSRSSLNSLPASRSKSACSPRLVGLASQPIEEMRYLKASLALPSPRAGMLMRREDSGVEWRGPAAGPKPRGAEGRRYVSKPV